MVRYIVTALLLTLAVAGVHVELAAAETTAAGAPMAPPAAAPAAALDPQLERLAQTIGETTMSPFCPGRTISSCPSPQARELRDQIRGWLGQGYSEAGVRNQLRVVYGEEVRGTPPPSGWLGELGWYAPLGFVIVSLVLVTWKIGRMNRHERVPAGTAPPAERLASVEAELQARLRR